MINYIIAIVLSLGILLFFLLWNKPIILIYLEVIFSLVVKVFITQIGFPSIIKYVSELICLYLFFWALIITKRNKVKTYAFIPIFVLIMLFIISLLSFFVHNYALSIYLEGMIKIYRFSAFFYSCIVFLDAKEAKRVIKLLLIFLLLNILASSYQYFIQGIRWDYNGGLFGSQLGGNAEMNVFLVVTSVIAVVMGINKKFNILISAAICAGGIYIALLSELKIYYLELVIIIIVSVMMSKPSIRSVTYMAGGLLAIVISINLLGRLYPLFADFFNLDTMMNYAVNDKYGGTSGNLNRLTALPYTFNHLLKTPVDKLIGIGMGNADVGTVFNNEFNYLKFDWYFDSYYLIENGILSVLLYSMFFIAITVSSIIFMRKDKENKEYYLISAIIGLFPFIFAIYDVSLISLVTYVLFLALSLPFIIYREKAG